MAGGLGGTFGTMAPPDVRGAGDQEWATVAGVPPGHPLLQSGRGRHDPDQRRGLVVTQNITPSAPMGAAGGATFDVFDNWRDLIDFRNSPAPYVLLGFFVLIGLMQLRLYARGGPAKVQASLG